MGRIESIDGIMFPTPLERILDTLLDDQSSYSCVPLHGEDGTVFEVTKEHRNQNNVLVYMAISDGVNIEESIKIARQTVSIEVGFSEGSAINYIVDSDFADWNEALEIICPGYSGKLRIEEKKTPLRLAISTIVNELVSLYRS